MKTNLLFTSSILAVAAIAFATSKAEAAGLMGQRYAGAMGGVFAYEADAYKTSGLVTAFYHQPISSTLDLDVSYLSRDRDSKQLGLEDGSREMFMVTACVLGQSTDGIPCLHVGLGWGQDDFGYRESDGLVYRIGIGAQFISHGNMALLPFLDWTDAFKNEDLDGALTYGADLAIDVSSSATVMIRVEGDDHFDWTFGVGAAFKF